MSEEHGSLQAGPGIGRRLEQAREARGLSLRRVEEITKIRARYLHELERENFDVLPTVYVLGSLKTYADSLGLDGTALSRELKESLEPDEAAVAVDPDETDDEHEAAPAVSIGFDHLFVGMGVVIVSVLALMTLVSAVARYEEPKVSQMNEPSVQDVPPEMALTGNVDPEPRNLERRDPESWTARETGRGEGGTDPDREEEPEPPKKLEGSEEDSLFGDVEFVPMSPSSPLDAASASTPGSVPASSTPPASTPPASTPPASTPPASTSPSAAPAASASATPDPPPPDTTSSPVAATPPAATGRPGDASAPPAPASVPPTRPAASSADAGSAPVAGPTRGGRSSSGPGSVFSPGYASGAGRIQAGVDATLERAIPGR